MFRFKLGIVIGYGLGWLVTSGKASELIDQIRERQGGIGSSSSPTTGRFDSTRVTSAGDSYDFAARAAD
jgi:hypothetical protein